MRDISVRRDNNKWKKESKSRWINKEINQCSNVLQPSLSILFPRSNYASSFCNAHEKLYTQACGEQRQQTNTSRNTKKNKTQQQVGIRLVFFINKTKDVSAFRYDDARLAGSGGRASANTIMSRRLTTQRDLTLHSCPNLPPFYHRSKPDHSPPVILRKDYTTRRDAREETKSG